MTERDFIKELARAVNASAGRLQSVMMVGSPDIIHIKTTEGETFVIQILRKM